MGSLLINRTTVTLTLVIAILVSLDVNKHGSFKGSKTGKFLRNSGALQYGEQAFNQFRAYSQQAYRWCQKPSFMIRTRDVVLPYLLIVKDVLATLALQLWTNLKVIAQYFAEFKSVVVRWMNRYVPGWNNTLNRWFTSLRDILLQGAALLLHYLSAAFQWLRDNVFVGKLSPESLQRYTMEAVNTTRSLAVKTLSWFNSKAVTVSSTV